MTAGIYKRKEENNRKHSERMKGKIPWNKGLTKETDDRVKKNGESISKVSKGKPKPKLSEVRKKLFREGKLKNANKGRKNWFNHTEKWKRRNSQRKIELWKDPNSAFHSLNRSVLISEKVSKARKIRKEKDGFLLNKNTRKKLKEKGLLNWENKEYKEKQIKAILKGLMKRPTSYEKKISELCIENSLPFVYTGDGRFLINFKNPDFTNHQDKVVIEVFHSYFKIRDYGSVENYKEFCRKKYIPAGWKVIFIDENRIDVDNWKELCLNKIKILNT